MSIATKCTCGHSLTGVCTSSVKECNQLIMEKTTQLPITIEVEIDKRMLELIPPELCFEGDQTYDLAASKRYEVQEVITAYATKLHQAQQENEELRRQNDKMKQQAEGWRPLLEEVLRRFSGISEAGGQPEDFNLINNIKKFLYGE